MYASPDMIVIRKGEQLRFRRGWSDPVRRTWIACAASKPTDRYVEAIGLNGPCDAPVRARFTQAQVEQRFW